MKLSLTLTWWDILEGKEFVFFTKVLSLHISDFRLFEAFELCFLYMQSSKKNVDKQGVIVGQDNRQSWQRICCLSTLGSFVRKCRLLSRFDHLPETLFWKYFESLCNLNPSLVFIIITTADVNYKALSLIICTQPIFFSKIT